MNASSGTQSQDPATWEREADLARKAACGNREALSVLLEGARPAIYQWARARVGDGDTAEDVTQVVLLRLLSHFPSFRGESRFSTWLFRITANECCERSRRRASRRRCEGAHATECQAVGSLGEPSESFDGRRLESVVRDLAGTLPPVQEGVFRLVDLDGLRPHEAATMMGTSPLAVRSSLCRARKKIRGLLMDSRPQFVREIRSERPELAGLPPRCFSG